MAKSVVFLSTSTESEKLAKWLLYKIYKKILSIACIIKFSFAYSTNEFIAGTVSHIKHQDHYMKAE